MKYNVIPLIPAYEPDEKLTKYVNELINAGFKKILIVNDGSSEKCSKYFKDLEEKQECIILKHDINRGKGQALKTGFKYYLENLSKEYDGIVTADSDGQHSVKDTINIGKIVEENKNEKALILGVRDFNKENVPFTSKYGNKLTKIIFKLLYGKTISDTQTGLRGFTNPYLEECINIAGDRYEYETNMLIYATRDNIKIIETTIDTIYIEENKSSHFNPIKDSLKIYKLLFMNFFKFSFSGLVSFAIDWILFVIFSSYIFTFLDGTELIMVSTIIARIISSVINFILNKNIVFKFKNKGNTKVVLIKYYILCIAQMIISGLLVSLITALLPISKDIIKIIVDLVLFFISYKIQSNVIFKK